MNETTGKGAEPISQYIQGCCVDRKSANTDHTLTGAECLFLASLLSQDIDRIEKRDAVLFGDETALYFMHGIRQKLNAMEQR